MKLLLPVLSLWAHLYTSTALQYARINIRGSSLKTINNNAYTSRDLLGVTFYNGGPALKDRNKLQMFKNDLGVNTVSFAETASRTLLPRTNRWGCCNKVQDLRNYINSGEACRNFANSYTPGIFSDPFFRQVGMTPFIYIRDVCADNNQVVKDHCVRPTSDGQAGVPKNGDGWWTELLSAYVKCALQVRGDLKYFHLWNEPNAYFPKFGKSTYTGTYFANFYTQVAWKIKTNYPWVKLGGAVTWNMAMYKDDFENWWIPLMERTLKGPKQLLDFFDWHAYDHGGENMHSEWDVVVATSEALSLYAGKKYGKYLKSSITETQYRLDRNAERWPPTNWKYRVITNAKQVIGLSHIPDKFDKRLLFDADAQALNMTWLNSVEYQAQKALKFIQGRELVDFEVEFDPKKPSNRQGTFYNQNIMAQVVWDQNAKKFYVVIVNDNLNEEVLVHLNDLDAKFRFNWPAKMARLSSSNKVDFGDYGFGISKNQAWITMKPKSVAVLNANNVVARPQSKVQQQEFRSSLECMMKKLKESTATSFNCGITIWRAGNARRAKLKLGLFWGAFGYKWSISAQLNGQNLLNVKDYIPVLRYNEFALPAQKLTKKGWIQVSFKTTKNKSGWIPTTRLAYVAVTIDYV